MGFSPILGIRIAQFVLSIIVLGTDGYGVSSFNSAIGGSPSSLNFLIFCCVWTWLSLAYVIITPRFLPRLHDKWAVLGVEVVATIFWFAGWIAVAAFIGPFDCNGNTVCGSVKAAIAFGCFEWLAWVASLVLVCLSIFKNKNMMGAMPMMGGNHAPLDTGVESAYTGAGGYDNPAPMGFNPSETPAPYSTTVSPAPYDPHMQPAHLQPQHTGVSSVSALSSGPYSGAGGYNAQQPQFVQSTPYDPHYSQHHDYSGGNMAEMPAATPYGGQDRGQPKFS